MDPAMQMQLLFGGGQGNQNQDGGQGQDQQGMSQQDQLQAGQNPAFAGYPALMRQYLEQQQGAQMAAMMGGGGMPNGMGGMNQNLMMGGMGGMDQSGQMMGMQGFQNPMMMGNPMQMQNMQMQGMMQGMGGGGSDYMDANRMLLQRLQGQQQPEQFDPSGTAAAAAGGTGADPYAENGILGPWSATSAGLLGKMAVNNQDKGKKVRRKPKDKPKRPLSAYNIFFKEERQRILEKIPEGDEPKKEEGDAKTRKRKKKPHGKIGFENLAKVIGQRWQELTPEQVEYYKKKAEEDMKRYKDQMEEYLAKQDGAKKKIDDPNDSEGVSGDGGPAKKIKIEN